MLTTEDLCTLGQTHYGDNWPLAMAKDLTELCPGESQNSIAFILRRYERGITKPPIMAEAAIRLLCKLHRLAEGKTRNCEIAKQPNEFFLPHTCTLNIFTNEDAAFKCNQTLQGGRWYKPTYDHINKTAHFIDVAESNLLTIMTEDNLNG